MPISGMTSGAAPGQTMMGTQDALARHGLQAACLWRPESGFSYFSPNWHHITGCCGESSQGDGFPGWLTPASAMDLLQSLNELALGDPLIMIDGADHLTLECEVINEQGMPSRILALTLVPMAGENAISILATNISEQRALSQRAEIAQAESQMAQAGRAAFLANMSHELRTPLNAILGFAQMLEHKSSSAATSEDYLVHIRESGEQLLVKINDLIELAHIDQKRSHLHEGPLNLGDILGAAMEMHSHSAFCRGITIRSDIRTPQLVLTGDRTKLIHCVSHLLSNAIRASVDGAQILLTGHADAERGIFLSVEDHGCGIARARLSNISLTLKARHSYYATDIGNIGLGLAIAKEFAELHGGRLQLDSREGEGTLATLTLPPARIISLSARVKHKRRHAAYARV